jgi:predicted O-methyltransferase YrrM
MIEVVKTGFWFLQRPRFWAHAAALGYRKFRPTSDTPDQRTLATRWAAERAVSAVAALAAVGIRPAAGTAFPRLPSALKEEAERLASAARVTMGGPGDIDLLYAAVVLTRAERIVETGVAYGWSSLAVLAGLEANGQGRLASVDMPYPKLNNEAWVGVAVPQRLRSRWTLVREPDRWGLKKALRHLGGSIDLCHYDSDKSYDGREYGYALMWRALRSGGLFISDDIQDNLAFRDFVAGLGAPMAVTEYQGKYVGIVRKP